MQTTAVLGLGFIIFFILALVVYLVKEFACRTKVSSEPPDSPDLEKGFVNNSLKANEIYSEVPTLVKPLRPPRTVEKIGSITLIDLTEEEKEEILKIKIRTIQDSMKLTTYAHLKCNLVIGVDGNFKGVGAYCVNLQSRKCQIYTYKLVCLPWDVKDPDDLVEVGMKNLLFALLLWQEEIKEFKSLRIYMGNTAMDSELMDPNTQKVLKLLKHFQNCEGVLLINADGMCIETNLDGPEGTAESEEEFAKFVRYVQPAVDLSHWRIKICERYLRSFYGIEDDGFNKTHCQMKWNKAKCRPWYETTYAYSDFLEKVRVCRENWSTPCSTCGFVDG